MTLKTLPFLALVACADSPTSTAQSAIDTCADTSQYELHGVGGANFNTLAVDPSILPLWQVGSVLADDQLHMLRMATDKGLTVFNKHVPAFMIFDAQGNPASILAGGFYQCATQADCQGYLDQVVGQYALGGVPFLARPEFHNSFQGHSYEDLGAAQFADVSADYAIKITRWRVTGDVDPRPLLRAQWQANARDEACHRGTLTQAHLLYSAAEHVIAEVTIGAKVDPPPGDPRPYFVTTLGSLAAQPPLVPVLDQLPWLQRIPADVTDTYLVITYWPSAFAPGRWPNSPSTTPGGPLPEPFCGDGTCNTTVTNVETAASCPVDCAATCGNGTCDGGETAVATRSVDRTQFRRSAAYGEFYQPYDLDHLACVWLTHLPYGAPGMTGLMLARSDRGGDFDRDEQRALGAVLPALTAATARAARLRDLDRQREALEAIAAASGPRMVMSRIGIVEWASRTALELVPVTPAALRAAARRLVEGPRSPATVPLHGGITAHLSIVRAASGEPLVLVELTGGAADPRVETLAAAFGLTRAEAAVLAELTVGLSNAAIAERLAVSVETVRTHVKRILGKLGVRSRVQAALLASRQAPPRS